MNSYVYSFSELLEPKLSEVGGKATNLIKLSNIDDVNLPEGFCITTTAYTETFESNKELDALLTELSLIKINELDCISEVSAKIRDVIVRIHIPEKISKEIAIYLAKLGEDKSYAVRSSATAEDQPTASFAGQHDTYLNIIGFDHILKHISKCWASLFTDRAVIYRTLNGFDHRKVCLAVVVQQMVFSDISGIMFTVDPITSNRKIVSIDASFGLGEALVSGLVNADNYKVYEGDITDKKIKTILHNQIEKTVLFDVTGQFAIAAFQVISTRPDLIVWKLIAAAQAVFVQSGIAFATFAIKFCLPVETLLGNFVHPGWSIL